MSRRLQALWHRPIAERERRPAFAVVAFTLVAVGAATWATVDTDDRPTGVPEPSAPAPASAGTVTTAQASATRSSATSKPHTGRHSRTPASVDAARRAAYRFLTQGYLAYAYGRARPEGIAPATGVLRRQLVLSPPRVPPAERTRHARIVALQVERAGAHRADAVAVVRDEARTYDVGLSLRRTRGGWRVAGVSG